MNSRANPAPPPSPSEPARVDSVDVVIAELTRAQLLDDARPFPWITTARNVCPVCGCRMFFRVIVYVDRVIWSDRRGHDFQLNRGKTPAAATLDEIYGAAVAAALARAFAQAKYFPPA